MSGLGTHRAEYKLLWRVRQVPRCGYEDCKYQKDCQRPANHNSTKDATKPNFYLYQFSDRSESKANKPGWKVEQK